MKKDKFKINGGNGNRYAIFKGILEGENISFKFTYTSEKESQVRIKTNSGILEVSLKWFNEKVKPIRDIKGNFVVLKREG